MEPSQHRAVRPRSSSMITITYDCRVTTKVVDPELSRHHHRIKAVCLSLPLAIYLQMGTGEIVNERSERKQMQWHSGAVEGMKENLKKQLRSTLSSPQSEWPLYLQSTPYPRLTNPPCVKGTLLDSSFHSSYCILAACVRDKY